MNIFSEIGTSSILGLIGLCAAATSIVVQVLKNILPQTIPTKILVVITSFIVVLGYTIGFETITIKNIISSIFGGFVISFVSMFGFDSLKDIIGRFTGGELKDGRDKDK